MLLYSGSIHGWKYFDFHSRCDNKGPTICLFKVKDGDCIGGFTRASWSSPPYPGKHIGQCDSMLFNLSSRNCFPSIKGNQIEIKCRSDHGPYFSSGSGGELTASDEPFNEYEKCCSLANKPGYHIPIDDLGNNMLTNKKNGYFTITELEVWEVKEV